MASITTLNLGFGSRRGLPDCRPVPECDPRPVCPACGGLECLCRPRFFAGQLLSEEDLNRLDHYIVAKNRLHNRHLHGTGVACGLEVVCSVCDPALKGTVTVKPGYALSPCGNDIVVCSETRVDVCDLINRCRPPRDDCFQPAAPGAPAATGDEEWVLAICYQEKPSRGITALRGNACACGCGGAHGSSGCGCGGGGRHAHAGGDCGCGCGGKSDGKTSAASRSAARPGKAAAQCEPTLTCETYGFAVYRKPAEDERIVDPGALIRRFLCCLEPFATRVNALPTGNTTNVLDRWLTDHLASIRDFLITEGLYDCDVAAKLSAVVAPLTSLERGTYLAAWNASARQSLEIVAAVIQKCLCAALLPPCPPPELNDCVPIATVTVTRGTCRVRHICNIDSRRFLVTWPAVQYWLSWLPLLTSWGKAGAKTPTLRERIERFCCTPISTWFGGTTIRDTDLRAQPPRELAPGLRARRSYARAPSAAEEAHPFTELFMESMSGGPEANPASLLLGMMGARAKDGSPLASETALQYPGQAMLLHQIVAPTLATLVPAAGSGPTRSARDSDSLARAVEKLEKTVKAQQKEIETLKRNR